MGSHSGPVLGGQRDAGVAAVEFTLVLPLLLLLVFGIVDMGRMAWAKMSVVSAANEAVRVVALRPTIAAADLTAIASSTASPFTITVPLLKPCVTDATSDTVAEVTVSTNFSFVTPLAPVMRIFGSQGTGTGMILQSTGRYRCLV